MKNILSTVVLSGALLLSSCEKFSERHTAEEQKRLKREQDRKNKKDQELEKSYRRNIRDSKAVITELLIDPLNEYEESTRVGMQYNRWSDKFERNLITRYVKDNKDFMIKTNNPRFSLLYTDSIVRTKLRIGDTLTLGEVYRIRDRYDLRFVGNKQGLRIEDKNNEISDDPRGINFGKSVVF